MEEYRLLEPDEFLEEGDDDVDIEWVRRNGVQSLPVIAVSVAGSVKPKGISQDTNSQLIRPYAGIFFKERLLSR